MAHNVIQGLSDLSEIRSAVLVWIPTRRHQFRNSFRTSFRNRQHEWSLEVSIDLKKLSIQVLLIISVFEQIYGDEFIARIKLDANIIVFNQSNVKSSTFSLKVKIYDNSYFFILESLFRSNCA